MRSKLFLIRVTLAVNIGNKAEIARAAFMDTLAVALVLWTTTNVAMKKNVHAKKKSTVFCVVAQKKKTMKRVRVNRVQLERHPMTIVAARIV